MRQAGSPARCSGASDTTWGSCGMRGRRRARACDYFRRTGAMIFAYITVFPRTRSGFFVYASMEGPARPIHGGHPPDPNVPLGRGLARDRDPDFRPALLRRRLVRRVVEDTQRVEPGPDARFLRPAVQPTPIRLEWDLVIAADVLDVRQFHRLVSLDFDRRHPCAPGVRTTHR